MKLNSYLSKSVLGALCALSLLPAVVWGANPARPVEKHAIVKSVDAAKHQVVLTDTAKRSVGTFLWSDQTKFTEEGKSVTAALLKEGATVDVLYAPVSTGTPVLQQVKFVAAKAAPKTTPATAPVTKPVAPKK